MSKPKRLPKQLRDLHDVLVTLECYDLQWIDDMKLRELVQAYGIAIEAFGLLALICGRIHERQAQTGMDTAAGLRAIGLRRDTH